MLKLFKAFFNVSCEICGKPVLEWDKQNVEMAIDGIGYGRTSCWNSQVGRWKQLGKAIQNIKKDIK
ncbi:hypothetical protein ACFLXD_06620 [Chloroflexota bacterium]